MKPGMTPNESDPHLSEAAGMADLAKVASGSQQNSATCQTANKDVRRFIAQDIHTTPAKAQG